jgi:hypothetical protein
MYEDLSDELFLDESDQFARTVSPAQMLQKAEMKQREAQQSEYAAHDRELFRRVEQSWQLLMNDWKAFRSSFYVHVIGLNTTRCAALLRRRGFSITLNLPWPVIGIDLIKSVNAYNTSRKGEKTNVPGVRKKRRRVAVLLTEDESGDVDMIKPGDKRLTSQEELDEDMNDLSSVHEVKRRKTGSPVASESSNLTSEEDDEEEEQHVAPLPSPPTKGKPASEGKVHN